MSTPALVNTLELTSETASSRPLGLKGGDNRGRSYQESKFKDEFGTLYRVGEYLPLVGTILGIVRVVTGIFEAITATFLICTFLFLLIPKDTVKLISHAEYNICRGLVATVPVLGGLALLGYDGTTAITNRLRRSKS